MSPPDTTTATSIQEYRTADQKPKGDVFDPDGWGELVKPGELIDIVELTPLTRSDRIIYNLLLGAAWDDIRKPIVHKIEKGKLKGAHQSNDRVDDSINRLMGTIAIAFIKRDGKKVKQRVQLLGPNTEEPEDKGFIYYRFPEELIALISDSNIYARLKSHVMFCFSSKYALSLWEMVEKRRNLTYTQKEQFSIKDIRGLLNVPKGKYRRFADLHRRVLKPALDEVNGLSELYVFLKPVKQGRAVIALQLSWFPKTPEARKEAAAELERHRAGRKARLRGNVEEVAFD